MPPKKSEAHTQPFIESIKNKLGELGVQYYVGIGDPYGYRFCGRYIVSGLDSVRHITPPTGAELYTLDRCAEEESFAIITYFLEGAGES